MIMYNEIGILMQIKLTIFFQHKKKLISYVDYTCVTSHNTNK